MYNSLMLPDADEGINKIYIVDGITQKIEIRECGNLINNVSI